MSTKLLLTTLAVLFACNYSSAQPQTDVTINEATVFLNGAEVSSTANVNLAAGESQMIFTNVANWINEKSMSVGVTNDVVIKSATFQSNYLSDPENSTRVQMLKDSMDLLENKIDKAEVQLTVTNEQIKLLSQNDSGAGRTELQPDEVVKMLDLVNARLAKHLTREKLLTKKLEKLKNSFKLIRRQYYNEKSKNEKHQGQILVTFFAEKPTNAKVKISYVVSSAGWEPSYDIRVASLSDPVEIFYKAHVYQTSGIDWNNVKLTLSTGNPTQNAQAPEFEPWHLKFYEKTMVGKSAGAMPSTQRQAYLAPDTVYVEDPVTGEANFNIVQREYEPGIDNSGVNTTFNIQLPYTIPSQYDKQNVAIKTVKVPASFRYYAAPKFESDVFLQALINDWENLNLLPAKTNIFFEGTFVGNGYIDAENLKDTMDISLGRDKKIVVERTADKKYRSKRMIGSNIKEQFLYNTTVRNLRNETIQLTLVDQIPVSDDKDIDVDDMIYDGATLDETNGKLMWQMKLQPNEKKEVRTGYTIKYPKGTTVNL